MSIVSINPGIFSQALTRIVAAVNGGSSGGLFLTQLNQLTGLGLSSLNELPSPAMIARLAEDPDLYGKVESLCVLSGLDGYLGPELKDLTRSREFLDQVRPPPAGFVRLTGEFGAKYISERIHAFYMTCGFTTRHSYELADLTSRLTQFDDKNHYRFSLEETLKGLETLPLETGERLEFCRRFLCALRGEIATPVLTKIPPKMADSLQRYREMKKGLKERRNYPLLTETRSYDFLPGSVYIPLVAAFFLLSFSEYEEAGKCLEEAREGRRSFFVDEGSSNAHLWHAIRRTEAQLARHGMAALGIKDKVCENFEQPYSWKIKQQKDAQKHWKHCLKPPAVPVSFSLREISSAVRPDWLLPEKEDSVRLREREFNDDRWIALYRLVLSGWKPGDVPTEDMMLAMFEFFPIEVSQLKEGRRMLLDGYGAARLAVLLSLVGDGFLPMQTLDRIGAREYSAVEPQSHEREIQTWGMSLFTLEGAVSFIPGTREVIGAYHDKESPSPARRAPAKRQGRR